MDLWDITRVLFRRWWIALPMALVSAVMGFNVVSTVRPDYRATGHLTLLPPTQQRSAAPGSPAAPQIVNPWNVYSLADALVIYTGRSDVKRDFANAGLSEEFTTTIGGSQLPIVELEVIASTPETAQATLNRLIEYLGVQLERLQAPYGAKGREAISIETLDSGQNVTPITSAKKRVLIVVAVLGLILTVSTSLVADAVVRRRARRRAATLPDVGSDAPSAVAGGPAGHLPTRPAAGAGMPVHPGATPHDSRGAVNDWRPVAGEDRSGGAGRPRPQDDPTVVLPLVTVGGPAAGRDREQRPSGAKGR